MASGRPITRCSRVDHPGNLRRVANAPFDTDRDESVPTGQAAASTWGGGAPAAREPSGAGAIFATGDDVIHANFGEGVIVGVEPGGLVVVRFAEDGSERKLMADYAPLKKR